MWTDLAAKMLRIWCRQEYVWYLSYKMFEADFFSQWNLYYKWITCQPLHQTEYELWKSWRSESLREKLSILLENAEKRMLPIMVKWAHMLETVAIQLIISWIQWGQRVKVVSEITQTEKIRSYWHNIGYKGLFFLQTLIEYQISREILQLKFALYIPLLWKL